MKKNVLKGRTHPSTATICKFRNCEQAKIQVVRDTGEEETIDIDFDPETKDGRKILRDALKKITDMKKYPKSKDIRSVDIGFPIPILEV